MRIIPSLALATLALSPLAVLAQQPSTNEGPAPTTALISIDPKHGAAPNPGALTLEINGHKAAIEGVQPVAAQQIELAILIDEGLRQSIALQLDELRDFINTLPPTTKVLVGYMRNGDVASRGVFSADKEAVIKDIRIPFSTPGGSASPYFCLSEFVKHWPSSDQRTARVVLMLTNGVDPYNGSVSILNQTSPYVQTAQEDAQRAGAAVYSIYYGDRGIRGEAAAFSGSSYLQQVAEATGGQLLYQGTFTPPSIAPFLKRLTAALRESYLIGFQAPARGHDRGLVSIKVRTTQPSTKVYAPDNVRAGRD